MSTNVQKLMRECLATWEHGYISTPIDLCGKSGKLLEWKEYVERHPVHYGARFASDIAIIKPLLREHAPELLIKDEFGRTLLDVAKLTFLPLPAPPISSAASAFRTPATPCPPSTSPCTARCPSTRPLCPFCAHARRPWGFWGMLTGRRGWQRWSCSMSFARN